MKYEIGQEVKVVKTNIGSLEKYGLPDTGIVVAVDTTSGDRYPVKVKFKTGHTMWCTPVKFVQEKTYFLM